MTPVFIEILAKMSLQMFFGYMQAAGRNEAEVRRLFVSEKEKFFQRPAADLKPMSIAEVSKAFRR
jgi:hypothetical protein